MAHNDYFGVFTRLAKGTKARADSVNALFDKLNTGLDKLPTENEGNRETRNYAANTGPANAYACALTHVLTSYATGQKINLLIDAADVNTSTSSTLNVSTIGNVAIKYPDGSDPAIGDLIGSCSFVYSGSVWHLVSVGAASASAAAASAAAALVSENAAASSETNAGNSAASAGSSAGSASTSASSAGSSASSASSSASAASTSESNASTSETNAATSETNAASSASAASTSETNAATSETNAASSASAASASETNAATSETNAAASAAAALLSESIASSVAVEKDRRQTIKSCATDSNGRSNYLSITSGLVFSVNGSVTPLVMSFSSGNKEYLYTETTDIALTAPSPSGGGYFFAEYDVSSDTVSYSIVASFRYTFSVKQPTTTIANSYWFDLNNKKSYIYDGSSWVERVVLIIGTVTETAGVINNLNHLAINGIDVQTGIAVNASSQASTGHNVIELGSSTVAADISNTGLAKVNVMSESGSPMEKVNGTRGAYAVSYRHSFVYLIQEASVSYVNTSGGLTVATSLTLSIDRGW